MKKINILWTGGLDSSFRVIELSQMSGIDIQPYYIVDPARSSRNNELRAIRDITTIIRMHKQTKAILRDLKLIQLSDIKPNYKITDAFERLHEKYVIGHQYDLIARYAEQNNIRFEMSLEKSDRSKAMNCILTETKLVTYKEDNYEVHRINPSESSSDGVAVFSHVDLPSSLWGMTKLEEVNKLSEIGHENTVKHTWFCHFPVWGMPCGHCNPCRDSINEGLSFRVPKLGYYLYYIYKPINAITSLLHISHNRKNSFY